MAASTKPPTVEYRHNVARGQHEVGVKVDGHFVTFAALDDAVVAQRIENAKAITANATADDDAGGE